MCISFSLDCFIAPNEDPFFIQYGSHDSDLFMHRHEDYSELVIVLTGTAIHKVNNDSFFIKKGDVFVINDGTVHGYEQPHDFRICNIMYRPDRLQKFHPDIRTLPGFHALFLLEPYFTKQHGFESRLKLSLTQFEYVQHHLDTMLLEYEQKAGGWKDMIDSYFTTLVVFLSRIALQTSSEESNKVTLIAKSLSYIENSFTEPITVEKLAEQSHLSVRHFTRIFKEAYNTSPNSYLLYLRLEHARLLLQTTNATISEIALQSGFTNSNYFTRQFHDKYQITPRDYRKTR